MCFRPVLPEKDKSEKVCPKCYEVNEANATVCAYCGTKFAEPPPSGQPGGIPPRPAGAPPKPPPPAAPKGPPAPPTPPAPPPKPSEEK